MLCPFLSPRKFPGKIRIIQAVLAAAKKVGCVVLAGSPAGRCILARTSTLLARSSQQLNGKQIDSVLAPTSLTGEGALHDEGVGEPADEAMVHVRKCRVYRQ